MTTTTAPDSLAAALTDELNTLIQSPAIQNLTWQMVSGCQDSTLNDMIFCSSASASGSYTEIPHADSTGAHVDTNDHVDTNNHVDTPNHVDTKLVHDDAHFDLGVSSHTDSVPHDDTSAHDDTSTSHDDTSLPHDDTSAHFDTPAVGCSYDVGLSKLTGVGSITVTDLTVGASTSSDQLNFPFSASLVIPNKVTAYGFVSIQQSPLPPLNDNSSVAVTATTGQMTGVLSLSSSSYYASVTSITISLPSSVTDYSGWSGLVGEIAALGFYTAWMVGAGDEVIAELNSLLNKLVSPIIVAELNSLLAGIQILPSNS